MSVNSILQEQALVELRRVVSELESRLDDRDLGGSDLILGCRRILNLWVNGGGSSLDDPVIGFTGIESQSDHVLGGSQVRVGRDVDRVRFKAGSDAEALEIEEIGRFFNESFKRNVKDLARYLNVS